LDAPPGVSIIIRLVIRAIPPLIIVRDCQGFSHASTKGSTKVLTSSCPVILNLELELDPSSFVQTFQCLITISTPRCAGADATDTRCCHCFLKKARGHPSSFFPPPPSLLFLLPRPSASHFNCFIIPACRLYHGFIHYSRRRLLDIRCNLCLQRR
jgi:hypothetical protein